MTSEMTWKAYYEQTLARPPRATLLAALSRFDEEPGAVPRVAIDLGCGAGRDTIELLRRGWRAIGVDREPDALERLMGRPDIDAEMRARLETLNATLEDAVLSPCDLVNASFSLQGCAKRAFPALWQRIREALRPGGRFAGHLLGERDTWADPSRNRNEMTFCTPHELEEFCEPFDVEWLEETEEDSVTPRGEAKHWHFYQIVLRKPD